MRTSNSIKNIIIALCLGFVAILITFIARRVFIDYLNIEYLGINGLFTNIVSMLAVTELGLGSAIIYHLYKPVSEKDYTRINSLMRFYKAAYRIIAGIIIIIGLFIMPFLPALTSDTELPINLYIIFGLFIGDAALSYLLSYKRSLLYADEKNYIINLVRIGGIIALNLAQIIILIVTKNYYLFIVLKLLTTLMENVILNYIVQKKYTKFSSGANQLDIATQQDIFTKAKGLLFHKFGSFVVVGTDNILISIFISVKAVGLYSNYLLIIVALNAIFSQFTTALTASVGNLLLEKNTVKNQVIFKKIYYANYWIATSIAVTFFLSVNPFITIWIGKEYLFSQNIVIALTIGLFLTMLRVPIQTFKTAAGIFHEDRYMPIIEATINLVLSIILLQFFGVIGVFIGTICSTLFLHVYSYPKYTYSRLFEKSWRDYWWLIAKSLLTAAALATLCLFIVNLISIESELLYLIACIGVAVLVPNIILFAVYRKTEEFTYFLDLAKNMSRKLLRIR